MCCGQGHLEAAVDAYRRGVHMWPSAVVYWQLATALVALGGPENQEEAREVLATALAIDSQMPGRPFRPMLLQLQEQLKPISA